MERFVTETLESVQAQTLPDFEAICLDDGSTDGTRKLMEGVARQDGRFRVLSGPGFGVSAARNMGLREARGRFILFLDADDLLAEDALSRFARALVNSEAPAAVAGVKKIGDDGAPLPGMDNRSLIPAQDHLSALLRKNLIVNGGAIGIRRTALDAAGGYDENLKNGEDWELWCRLALLGDFEIVSGGPVLFYRQVASGANVRTRGSAFALKVPCLEKIAANPEMRKRARPTLSRCLRARRIDIFWSGVRNRYHHGNRLSALLTGIAGLVLYPDSFLRPNLALRFVKSLSRRREPGR